MKCRYKKGRRFMRKNKPRLCSRSKIRMNMERRKLRSKRYQELVCTYVLLHSEMLPTSFFFLQLLTRTKKVYKVLHNFSSFTIFNIKLGFFVSSTLTTGSLKLSSEEVGLIALDFAKRVKLNVSS